MLISSKEILLDAKKYQYAIPAFNVENVEMAQACIEAGEEMSSPIILATTEGTNKLIPLDVFEGFVKPLAEKSKIPIVLHLDHAKTMNFVLKAIKAGYTSVMIDASKKSYIENVALTKEIKDICEIFNIPVEAELGVIVGKKSDGTDTFCLTEPETVQDFAIKTKVDSLAISIGNKHGLYKTATHLDFDRLSKINNIVEIPLVLHGASGIPDNDLEKCVNLGISKCNFATELRIAYTNAIKQELNKKELCLDPREFLAYAKMEVKEVCKSKIKILGCEKRV